MDAAVLAAGEVPQHPAVHRSERQLAGVGLLAGAFDIVQNPLDLRTGEVGRQRQAADLLEAVRALVTGQFVADLLRTGVLPDDRVVHRLAGLAVPDQGRFALIGDADRGDLMTIDTRPSERLSHHLVDTVADLVGIVLHPAGSREDLLMFQLTAGHDLPSMIEDDGA